VRGVARIGVLASGEGTNLQALLDDPALERQVALVVSDRVEAPALRRARDRGVPTIVVEPGGFDGRDSYDSALVAVLEDEHIDLVVLAGFMRVLGPALVHTYSGRIINVHPALLPSFPGTHGVSDALEYGVKVTGVTVHLVDEGVDTGPIILQEAVEIRDDDDRHSLEERIHDAEHRLLPRAVRAAVEGRISVDGRTVRIKEES
jgi:phosphoribosylglycinamide formyltransferase 1